MITCQYCGSELSTVSNLKYHQENAKKCLSIRGLSSSKKCEYCDKTFSTKQRLNQHFEVCQEKKIKDCEYNTEQILYLTERNKELEIESKENNRICEGLREKEILYRKELEEKEKKIENLINQMNKNHMETIQLVVSKGKGSVNNGIINIQNNSIITERLSDLCNNENIQRQVDMKLTKEYMVKQGELEYAYGDFFTDHIARGENGHIQATSDGKNFKYMGDDNKIKLDKGGNTLKSIVKKTCFVPSMNKKIDEIWKSSTLEERKDSKEPPQIKELGWRFMDKVRDRTSVGTKDADNIKRAISLVPTSNEDCIQEIKDGKKKDVKRKKDNKKHEIVMKGEIAKLDVYIDEETVTDMIKRKTKEREQNNKGKTLKWILISDQSGEIDKIEEMLEFDNHKEILDEQIKYNEQGLLTFKKSFFTEKDMKNMGVDRLLVAVSEKKTNQKDADLLRFYMKKV